MSNKSRGTSNRINDAPYVYTDADIDDQTNRQRLGDLWITEQEGLRAVEHKEPLTVVKVVKTKIHKER